jgi:hypothetical protein
LAQKFEKGPEMKNDIKSREGQKGIRWSQRGPMGHIVIKIVFPITKKKFCQKINFLPWKWTLGQN